MKAGAVKVAVGAVLAAVCVVAAGGGASANLGDTDDSSTGGGANTGSEFIAWSLAYASHQRGTANPIPCEVTQPARDEEGEIVVDEEDRVVREVVQGFLSYETTLNPQEVLRGISGEDRAGRFIRVECNGPDIVDDNIANLLRVPFIVDVDALDLLDVSLERMGLPEPPVSTSPGGSQPQLVNLPTWLWLDGSYWQPRTLTATADAGLVTITATLTAVPEEVVWDMGDGGSVPCAGPGTAYDRSRPASAQTTDCSYTYRRSSAGQPGSAYTMTATVTWSGSYSLNIGGGGDLGTIDVTSAPVPVRVAESQAVVGG